MLAGGDEPAAGVAPAGSAATAAAVAAASAEAIAAASPVGAVPTAGVDGPLPVDAGLVVAVASPEVAAALTFTPLSPDVACWIAVTALAFAAAFALTAAATALAVAAACLMPYEMRAVAPTLLFVPVLVAALLLEGVLPLPLAGGPEFAVFCAPEACWLGPESVVLAVDPPADEGCCGCCAAWEAAADWAGEAPGGFDVGGFVGAEDEGGGGDAAVAAFSKAANGCEAVS